MRVGIATVQVPFVHGGAEALALSLLTEIRAAGHEADIISLPFKWYPAGRIPEHMLAARLLQVEASVGQPIDRLIGMKFPAYLMPHPSKRLWLLHQHRSAYDGWDHADCDLLHAPNGAHIRSVIRTADQVMLAECEAVYTISRTVSDRLRRYNGVAAEPLYHPPPDADRLRLIGYEDAILFPGRVNASKRQHLAIEALALTRHPVRMVFFGASDATEYHDAVRQRCTALGLDGRVEWRGQVDATERLDLYGRCLAVMFVPVEEDLGYVTLEAMLCGKAVLTASDSGGPLDFVEDGYTGLVRAPTAAELADALDTLWSDRGRTRALGAAGADRYHALQLGWSRVLDCLLG